MEENRIRVFVPGVRSLTPDEIAGLPEEKVRAAEEYGASGIWLEVPCLDLSCVTADDHITIPVKGAPQEEKKGFFLNLFCPRDTCEVYGPTDLP